MFLHVTDTHQMNSNQLEREICPRRLHICFFLQTMERTNLTDAFRTMLSSHPPTEGTDLLAPTSFGGGGFQPPGQPNVRGGSSSKMTTKQKVVVACVSAGIIGLLGILLIILLLPRKSNSTSFLRARDCNAKQNKERFEKRANFNHRVLHMSAKDAGILALHDMCMEEDDTLACKQFIQSFAGGFGKLSSGGQPVADRRTPAKSHYFPSSPIPTKKKKSSKSAAPTRKQDDGDDYDSIDISRSVASLPSGFKPSTPASDFARGCTTIPK